MQERHPPVPRAAAPASDGVRRRRTEGSNRWLSGTGATCGLATTSAGRRPAVPPLALSRCVLIDRPRPAAPEYNLSGRGMCFSREPARTPARLGSARQQLLGAHW